MYAICYDRLPQHLLERTHHATMPRTRDDTMEGTHHATMKRPRDDTMQETHDDTMQRLHRDTMQIDDVGIMNTDWMKGFQWDEDQWDEEHPMGWV